MEKIRKNVAATFTDVSNGETGPLPPRETVHGYFDTMEEAVKATNGAMHSYREEKFSKAEWDAVLADIVEDLAWEAQYEEHMARMGEEVWRP